MCNHKTSLLSWWLVCLLAVFFWCRDYRYDRVIAAFAFVLALIYLIEYGVYSNMNKKQGARLLICVLWLLAFILALSVMIYTKSITVLIWWLFITVIFLFAVFYAFTSDNVGDMNFDSNGMQWSDVTDGLEWLIILSIAIPFVFLLSCHNWCDMGIYLCLIYILVSGCIVWYLVDTRYAFSVWIYSLIGILFIVWFIGMFE